MKSKKELQNEVNLLKGRITRSSSTNQNMKYLIRHFQLRLKKIKNEIDYLLTHPYSTGNGNTGKKKVTSRFVKENNKDGNKK